MAEPRQTFIRAGDSSSLVFSLAFETSALQTIHSRAQFNLLDFVSELGGLMYGLYVTGWAFLAVFGYGNLNTSIV